MLYFKIMAHYVFREKGILYVRANNEKELQKLKQKGTLADIMQDNAAWDESSEGEIAIFPCQIVPGKTLWLGQGPDPDEPIPYIPSVLPGQLDLPGV
jgi:hypothetical protein